MMVAPDAGTWTTQQVALIKEQIAPGVTDAELALFGEVCRRTGLDPFARQIYAIRRNQREQDADGEWKTRQRMTIQTGIDGYRLTAARSGLLAGIDDAQFDTEEGDHPAWARVTVWRMVSGQRCPFTATARWREYAVVGKDGQPTGMWRRMPWLMLGKCAEALALRKAFPAELSGVYTGEEMDQADAPPPMVVGTVEHAAPYQTASAPRPKAPAAKMPTAKGGNTPLLNPPARATVDALTQAQQTVVRLAAAAQVNAETARVYRERHGLKSDLAGMTRLAADLQDDEQVNEMAAIAWCQRHGVDVARLDDWLVSESIASFGDFLRVLANATSEQVGDIETALKGA